MSPVSQEGGNEQAFLFMYMRKVFLTAAFVVLQASRGWAQTPVQQEPVPDWLAWQMFQEGTAFHNQKALAKPAAPAAPVPKRGLPPPQRLNGFEYALKKQFGLSPEHTAALVSSGQFFLAELESIQTDAKAEMKQRYTSPAAVRAQGRGPQKTLLQRVKEDGLYAEVDGKRQAALNAHLQVLSRSLTPAAFAKVSQWVRTGVTPRIVVMSERSEKTHAASTRVAPKKPVGTR